MKNSIVYSFLVLCLVLSSCGDDDGGNSPLSIEDAKASMDNMAADMTTDVVNVVQSEGVEALDELFNLLDLNDPFGGRLAEMDQNEKRKWLKERAMLFKTIFIPTKSINFNRVKDSDFDFDGNKGIYNWNPLTEEFEKSEEASDFIIINFPSEGSETNNVALRITNYAEESIVEEEDGFVNEYYAITELNADLSVDGTTQVSVDLLVDYNDSGDPVSLNGSLFVNPYTFTVTFNDTQATVSTLTASITEGSNVITSADLTVTFETSDKEELIAVSGFVQYLNIKLQGSIDVTGADDEGDDFDINEFISLELFDGDNKIGDIVLVYEDDVDGYEEEVIYVEYADGSKERLEDILQPVIDEFEDQFDDWG
ncbi:MAG: hypothetical protein AAGA02_12965 [Bacteroidota bacterium]